MLCADGGYGRVWCSGARALAGCFSPSCESRHGNEVTAWVEAIAVKPTWVDQWLKQNSGESLIWYGGTPDT